jgi:aldose 1-epimerase
VKPDYGLLVLEVEATRLALDPRRGGTIRSFSWRSRDIFRPTPVGAGDHPMDTACFPLVPFANRVAHGRFTFGGRAVQLTRNWSGDPHPIHGRGWRVPWHVVASSPSRAVLRFEGGADEWPWRYRCEQTLRLLRDGLSVELSIENLSEEPMPAMLGLHPYFPDAPDARLAARLPRVWRTDQAALPVAEVETPAAWGFEPARSIQSIALDHSFGGWNGSALLTWPGRSVTLRARQCGSLHVYASAGRNFFCVEPQTAAAGALGRGGGDVTVIEPGRRFAIRVDFEVGET